MGSDIGCTRYHSIGLRALELCTCFALCFIYLFLFIYLIAAIAPNYSN